MKRILKSRLLIFIFGVILSTSVTSVLAYSILALNVGYNPTDESWKNKDGTDMVNVDMALNDLYERISELGFEELYTYSPGTPANFSYTFETNTKNVLVILTSIYDASVSEVDSTISFPSESITLFDNYMGEMINRHQGYLHAQVHFMENALGTITGRISYRGQIKIIKINRNYNSD